MATQQEFIVAKFNAVDNTQSAFKSMNDSLNRTKKQTSAVQQQFRFMRGGLGQVGHQIQDVAVQLQMGTNAMIVFGQQGSQIASLFGPQGALIGAVLAVGAAISVGLTGDVKEAKNAIKELEDKINDFADNTGILTTEFADFLKLARGEEIKEQTSQFDELIKRYGEAERRLLILKRQQEENEELQIPSLIDFPKEIEEQENAIVALRAELRMLKLQMEGVDEAYKESADKRSKAAGIIIQRASDELDAIVRSQNEQKKSEESLLRAKMAHTSAVIRASNVELNHHIEALNAKKDANLDSLEHEREMADARVRAARASIDVANRELDAVLEAERKKQEAKQKTNDTISQSLSFMNTATGSIMGMLDEQSGAYKALFVVQQATQIAQAIMSAHAAAANALAFIPPPANATVSATMLALGYAQAAAIAGQTLASFEGGGMTGSGVRSGGMDGKGGRLAMVHPNEKITDLHKGGAESQPVSISFNIQANDARGFDELLYNRRGLITSMVNQALNNQGKRLA